MGDFVGGLLKYVKTHPVERVTIAGGFGKLAKLAGGAMDLHSARSSVDIAALTAMLKRLAPAGFDAGAAAEAVSANAVLEIALASGVPLATEVARQARLAAQRIAGSAVRVDVLVVDRGGMIVGESA
jgi:cobalt-precorrin-5B (C1)-methyltransferase